MLADARLFLEKVVMLKVSVSFLHKTSLVFNGSNTNILMLGPREQQSTSRGDQSRDQSRRLITTTRLVPRGVAEIHSEGLSSSSICTEKLT